jgi:uncharacterized repeat protein (TIGR01451 family)
MEDQILNQDERSDMPQQIFQMPERKPWYKNFKIIGSAILALILIAGIVYYFVMGKSSPLTPTSNQVNLFVKGPGTVSASSEAEFHIVYHNGEDADLTNVHIDMIYPSNFQFKSSTPASKTSNGQAYDLPIVRRGQDGELVIRGKLSGGTGEQKTIIAKLHYKLSNFNSNFEVDQSFSTVIQAPNLTFDVSGPVEVPVGQDTTFTVNYANVSGQDYDSVALQLTYPAGFKFSSASMVAAKSNNYWVIGKLPRNAKGSINITGSFLGQNLEDQILTGQLGQVINNTFTPQISSSATFRLKNAPITITQKAEPSDVVETGDSVNFTIYFENSGSVGLTNLVITDTINSNLVDLPRLSVYDGTITGSTITWKTATNSNLSILSPGKTGQVNFSLPIKQSLSATLKNQILKNSVSVVSSEITTPIRAQDVEIKLGSKLGLDLTGDYVSGALPMQVGKSTTFAITMTLNNASNDLNSTEVVASLPLPASSWNNVIIPDSEKTRLHFDPSSGLIRWDIGNLAAFTGKLTPVLKVTLQLVVTPSVSDQGQIMRLLSNIGATAFDSFTNQKLTTQPINDFSTSDVDDATFQSAGSSVQ